MMHTQIESEEENRIAQDVEDGDVYVVNRDDLGIDGNMSRILRDFETFCDVGGGSRCLDCECVCRNCWGFFTVAGGETTIGISEGVRGETESSESVDEGDSSGTRCGAAEDVRRREWRRSVCWWAGGVGKVGREISVSGTTAVRGECERWVMTSERPS